MTHVINQGMSMYWGTSRWSAMEIMEAYSVARQFNLIPPVCEQAEYHFFQRDKVETQLPELYHKIGKLHLYWTVYAVVLKGYFTTFDIPVCQKWSKVELSQYSMPQKVNCRYQYFCPSVPCDLTPMCHCRCGCGILVTSSLWNHHWEPYAWLKEKIVSEDGRKQQAKLKELTTISEKLGCTLPQLAIAWCLRNEGVSSVLLGTSNPIQLAENLRAMEARRISDILY
ncbi:unnamed protein product, partial [Coregonus sp. 'balchen']